MAFLGTAREWLCASVFRMSCPCTLLKPVRRTLPCSLVLFLSLNNIECTVGEHATLEGGVLFEELLSCFGYVGDVAV